MTANTVLVTGAFGQVGKRCTQLLLQRGRTVVAMDLRNDNTAAVATELAAGGYPGTLIPAYTDLLDAEAVRDLVTAHQPDAVVHLAAVVSPLSYRKPDLARRVNVGGTENLLAACTALPRPPLFLMASSAAVYGSRNPYRQPERITRTPGEPDRPIRPGQGAGRGGNPGQRAAVCAVPARRDHLAGHPRLHQRRLPAADAIDAQRQPDARGGCAGRGAGLRQRRRSCGHHFRQGAAHRRQRVLRAHPARTGGRHAGGRRAGPARPVGQLPGNPADDRGWSFTGWYDTTEAQQLLDFQEHDWSQTVAWLAESQGRSRLALRLLGPLLRPLLRTILIVQRRLEDAAPTPTRGR